MTNSLLFRHQVSALTQGNTQHPSTVCYFKTICCLLPRVPGKKNHIQNTHISKVIALFASTTVWQSGGDAPYCKTAVTARWALPKLPSGRWAVHFPLVPSPPFCFQPPLFVKSTAAHPGFISLPHSSHIFPLLALLSVILHLYLPVHPPPSRPRSHSETRGSVKIGRRVKGREEWGGHDDLQCISSLPPFFFFLSTSLLLLSL